MVLILLASEDFRSTIRCIYEWDERLKETKRVTLLIEKAYDIERAKSEQKVEVIFAFHSGPLIEDDIRILEIFKRLTLKIIVGLATNDRNQIGDGSTERTDYGLGQFGVEMLQETNRAFYS